MNDPVYQQLVEAAWLRELTPGELQQLEAVLKRDASALDQWRAEMALNSALRRLPDRALPSNFTAQVLQAVERADRQSQSVATEGGWLGQVFRWQPVGWAALALALGVGGVAYQRVAERNRIARDLCSIPAVQKLPSAEVLQDFDAILHLGQVPEAPGGEKSFSDEELLAALK